MTPDYIIRPQYIELVKRYEKEQDLAKKIQMKHKFIFWIKYYYPELTSAEIEYLMKSIAYVEDIYN